MTRRGIGDARSQTMRLAWLALLAACGGTTHGRDDGSPGPDGSVTIQCSGRTTPVSYQTDVVPLVGHCGGEICHGGLGPSWPYTQLVNVVTPDCSDQRMIVKPGDPANSYLIQKLDGVDMCKGV